MFHGNGTVTLIMALLAANGVVFCFAYSAYVRFQYEQFRRVIPGLWATGNRFARDGAHLEMLLATDRRMGMGLRGLLFTLRLLLLVTLVLFAAYVAGIVIHL